jgi:hypothetical protein
MKKIKTKTLSLIILLEIILFTSCNMKPCQHQKIYENCSAYQIEWSQGFRKHFENIYFYKVDGNCAIFTKGTVCFNCGAVIGFIQGQVCGSFHIKNHVYCY